MPLIDREASATRDAGDMSSVLHDALDALQEGLAVFDAEGGLVLCNSRYAEFYALPPEVLRVGVTFPELARTIAFNGRVPAALGREEDWIADRVARHARADGDFDHQLSDGRWLRATDKVTRQGRRVGIRIDITELKRSESSFRILFEANPVPILVQERDTLAVLSVNDAALRLFGYDRSAFMALTMGDLCAIGRTARFVEGQPWRCKTSDGRLMDLMPYSSDSTHEGCPATVTALVDMTELKRGQEELQRTRSFLDSVVETIPSFVFVKDMPNDGRYVLFNRAGELLAGCDRDEVLGRDDREIFSADLASRLRAQDAEVLSDGGLHTYEQMIQWSDGTRRLMQTREVPIAGRPGEEPRFVLGIADDITDRREMERRVDRAARLDLMTGLPNRMSFVDTLRFSLRARRRGQEGLALLLIDLDDFRVLNDALGHVTGDALLRAVGERLAAEVRGPDSVARLGADEFVVLQSRVATSADAERLAARLLEAFDRPFTVGAQDLKVGASIGIATVPMEIGPPGSRRRRKPDPDIVLRHAELALRRAKVARRGAHMLFEPRMDEELQRRRALEKDLRGALDRGEFFLLYQPQVDLSTETVSGFEALVRWRHPVRGMVDPGVFIPVAEETGLIVRLGAWILREACREAMTWPSPVRVAVNLSPVQFVTPGLFDAVAAALVEAGLPPSRLELEITESVRLIDNDANLATLHRLGEAGLHVALDDFGTGFASLSYLRSFPFSKIKIDRSFVGDLGRDEGCLAIVRATIRLARDLGMDTIAEGVETQLQFLQLRQLGCVVGQGYLFGRPLASADVAAALAQYRRQAV